jgi:GntR family transcriptional regulator
MRLEDSGGIEGPCGDLVIDPASPIPLYYQLQELLQAKIEAQQLKSQDRLPAERDIASHLGVSRMTVRQALDRLEDDGLLVRRRGDGTFVARPKVIGDLQRLRTISMEAAAQGRRSESRMLEMTTTRPTPPLRRSLGVDDEPDAVIRLRRVRSMDGEALSLETSWLPTSLCRPLLDADLSTGSLNQALADLCHLRLAKGDEQLTATVVDEYEADLLGIPARSPAFLVARTTWDDEGRPVEFVKSVLRGDRFAFRTALLPDEAANPARPIATQVAVGGSGRHHLESTA